MFNDRSAHRGSPYTGHPSTLNAIVSAAGASCKASVCVISEMMTRSFCAEDEVTPTASGVNDFDAAVYRRVGSVLFVVVEKEDDGVEVEFDGGVDADVSSFETSASASLFGSES